ncbi:ParB/RepB/Spo0J family partition protein [Acidicapsa acidisoli]|uniref:ParB/RepB/Spo0J family partition protein n=1 Tax=Acidicapsa acidisoli TaxID=1615681 RepID=UPI0021E05004|nr:ParB/RepB/Spo0J family partition protein [Acidicapsa acidisoli]
MNTTIVNATEYRDLPLAMLTESTTNPRRAFAEDALKELAASIRTQGVLSPLLVRPLNERIFEIVAGARRYRAAQMAEVATVPVRIVNLTDAEAMEAALVENLIRADVHPMEEATGFARLLALDEPKYSIEQLSARTGKNPAYVAARLKLVDLVPIVVETFYRDEIGVGHALLLAKLQPDQQERALVACFKEDWSAGGQKAKRILLPVRSLQFWIESNILLVLKEAPFDKRDAQLVPAAGSCVDCPKRTGHNKLLFSELGKQDSCSDPSCYQSKVSAHLAKTIAAKPQLVQISTAYGVQKEGSTTLPRNKYTAIRDDKPKSKEEATRPEFKVCKFTAEAIITEGSDVGTVHKVCANFACPVHHPKKQAGADDAKSKAEQEKQRKEAAIANTTGVRVLAAIAAAVPVRLMKRDLLFVAERLARLVDEPRLEIIARQHGIKKAKDSDYITKLFAAYLRCAEESVLGSVLVELTILLSATRNNSAQTLRDAATAYKVDAEAIALKVKQEFAAKDQAKAAKKDAPKQPAKQQAKAAKKPAAA